MFIKSFYFIFLAFSASLYRQAGGGSSIDEHSEEHDHTHITPTLSSTPSPPSTAISSSSSAGYYTSEYGYSGRGYVTQNYLWFYHCSLMTCINTVIRKKQRGGTEWNRISLIYFILYAGCNTFGFN